MIPANYALWWYEVILLTLWIFSSWFKDVLWYYEGLQSSWTSAKLPVKLVLGKIVSLYLCPGWEEQQEACMSHRTKTQNVIPKREWWPYVWGCRNRIGEVSCFVLKGHVMRVKPTFSLRRLYHWIRITFIWYSKCVTSDSVWNYPRSGKVQTRGAVKVCASALWDLEQNLNSV